MEQVLVKRWRRKIKTRAGVWVTAHEHVANFWGNHNSAKSRCLLILYHRKFTLKSNSGISVRELSTLSGVSYRYLRNRLNKWTSWLYVLRKASKTGKRNSLYYKYTIDERGIHFVEDRIPKQRLQEYVAVIRAVQARG
jgi:hypothetical protein